MFALLKSTTWRKEEKYFDKKWFYLTCIHEDDDSS